MHKAALFLAPLALAVLPIPASAQIALEGEVYAQSDGWRVSVEPLGCILANLPAADRVEFWVLRTDYGVTDLSIRLPTALARDDWDAPVSLRIGDVREVAEVTYAGQRLLLTQPPSEAFIEAFRTEGIIDIFAEEGRIGQVVLGGSDGGFTQLLECAESLPQTPTAPSWQPNN